MKKIFFLNLVILSLLLHILFLFSTKYISIKNENNSDVYYKIKMVHIKPISELNINTYLLNQKDYKPVGFTNDNRLILIKKKGNKNDKTKITFSF